MSRGNTVRRCCIGSKNNRATIDERKAARIKWLLRSGMKHRDIADSESVSIRIVEDISCGKTWVHVMAR